MLVCLQNMGVLSRAVERPDVSVYPSTINVKLFSTVDIADIHYSFE